MKSNVQKMRTILRNIKHRIVQTQTDGNWSKEDAHAICDSIDYALSIPLRNCDVGTPEEQAKRMDVYCSMHGKDESGCYRCEKCKLMRVDRCELAWAQMPYEAEEGGAE